MSSEVKVVKNFHLLKALGSGVSGSVYLAKSQTSGELMALKEIKRSCLTPRSSLRFQNETEVMRALNHRNILKLYDVLEEEHFYYLVLDYAEGGDLLDYLVRSTVLTEEEARNIFHQVCSAVHFCHTRGYVHRDLKLENIMLDKNLSVVVGDWGFACSWGPKKQLTESCGSIFYAAPEIYRGDPYAGPEVDIWSLGVLLFIMCSGRPPFPGTDVVEVFLNIERCRIDFPSSMSSQLKDLITKMLVHDRSKRMSLDFVLSHPWISGKKPDMVLPLSLRQKSMSQMALPIVAMDIPRSPRLDAKLVGPIRSMLSTPKVKKSYLSGTINPQSAGTEIPVPSVSAPAATADAVPPESAATVAISVTAAVAPHESVSAKFDVPQKPPPTSNIQEAVSTAPTPTPSRNDSQCATSVETQPADANRLSNSAPTDPLELDDSLSTSEVDSEPEGPSKLDTSIGEKPKRKRKPSLRNSVSIDCSPTSGKDSQRPPEKRKRKNSLKTQKTIEGVSKKETGSRSKRDNPRRHSIAYSSEHQPLQKSSSADPRMTRVRAKTPDGETSLSSSADAMDAGSDGEEANTRKRRSSIFKSLVRKFSNALTASTR